MVGVRSMGLALESVIGFESGGKEFCLVPEYQLKNLVEVSNDRFKENTKRIEKFRMLLRTESESSEKRSKDGGEWEDAQVRRKRKKAEGLKKAQIMKQSAKEDTTLLDEDPESGFLEQNT